MHLYFLLVIIIILNYVHFVWRTFLDTRANSKTGSAELKWSNYATSLSPSFSSALFVSWMYKDLHRSALSLDSHGIPECSNFLQDFAEVMSSLFILLNTTTVKILKLFSILLLCCWSCNYPSCSFHAFLNIASLLCWETGANYIAH